MTEGQGKSSIAPTFSKRGYKIKGMNKQQQLILVYTIHLSTVHVCTKFKPSLLHSSEENCDKNLNVQKLERKKNEKIKGQISSSCLIPVYTIHLPIVHASTKFQLSMPLRPVEKCDEKMKK